MITKVNLRNFKRIENETFDFTDFDLLVGANNSGKSTILQALAIWQYCIDEFQRIKKTGSRGIQIVLPNFTAISLPEFILLWKDKSERKNIKNGKTTKPEFILIDIEVFWKSNTNIENSLTVQLRYQSPQSIFAIPVKGWDYFQQMSKSENFPKIVYVPPFSALEPIEKWQDDGNVKQNVGKGQPGSVLRNLLYRVIDKNDILIKDNKEWKEINEKINEWFGVNLNFPDYIKGVSTMIGLSFKSNKRDFDIISGGSGFHQILTLLAFYYGYSGLTTILFDEPDAHLHVNLQRKILQYFKSQRKVQFIIATHAEEFVRGVEVGSIISILSGKPSRVQSSENIIRALSEVDNMVIVKTNQSPYILYIEGEDDARILSAWASVLGYQEVFNLFHIHFLGGTTKNEMKKQCDTHYNALNQINNKVKRVLLFDRDTDDSYHPEPNNPVIKEWKRKNIENYLLIPDAWKCAVLDILNIDSFDLYSNTYQTIIDEFFIEQGLILPKGFNWTDIKANIYEVIDGKKILFENTDSLFHRLRNVNNLKVNKERITKNMTKDFIHRDIIDFFDFINQVANETTMNKSSSNIMKANMDVPLDLNEQK